MPIFYMEFKSPQEAAYFFESLFPEKVREKKSVHKPQRDCTLYRGSCPPTPDSVPSTARSSGTFNHISQSEARPSRTFNQMSQSQARSSGTFNHISQSEARSLGTSNHISQSDARSLRTFNQISQSEARSSGTFNHISQSEARSSGKHFLRNSTHCFFKQILLCWWPMASIFCLF